MFARRLDDDLAEEMRDHLERRSAELRDQGMDIEEAQRQAALMFGNRTQIRERSHNIRLWTGLEITLQDLRYAWRGLRKSPAMAATAILSLALAIGANTAIYSILDAAMLRPLPVPQPDRLIRLASPGITQPGEDIAAQGDRSARERVPDQVGQSPAVQVRPDDEHERGRQAAGAQRPGRQHDH